MTKSMTGYGKGSFTSPLYTITIEAKSVNHRFLECVVRIPRTLLSVEDLIKKQIQEQLHRGRVEVFVSLTYSENKQKRVAMNWDLLSQLEQVTKKAKEESDLFHNFDASTILFHPEVLQIEEQDLEDDSLQAAILHASKEAISNLVEMRKLEGKRMHDYLLKAITELEKHSITIQSLIPQEEKRQHVRLQQKLEELKLEAIDENRLVMEVALLVEKFDITEEITRLFSHIEQLKETIELKQAIGRKLDFLLQEANREVNTIASKTASIEIKKMAIAMKLELEKMREQVQNIE